MSDPRNSAEESSTPPTASPKPANRFRLSEDWLATIVGLVIVLVIGAGILGPGPQTVTLTAGPGATEETDALPLDGWKVSATLAGEKAGVTGSFETLEKGQRYVYRCSTGQIARDTDEALPGDFKAPTEDRAQLVLINDCDQKVVLTYKTDYAIRWPVFDLVNR
jgi:hypothetical protein